jgi:rRNA processing protein Gar1
VALRRLGKALHLTKSQNLIVKLESSKNLPMIGTKVFNKKLIAIGRIHDFLGPVTNPYSTIKLETSDSSDYIGNVLYYMTESD